MGPSFLRRLGCAAAISSILGMGCDAAQVPARSDGPGPPSKISDEPSPNASILPEPLGEAKDKTATLKGETEANEVSPVIVQRPKPTPISIFEALGEDPLPPGRFGGGYEARARFVWPAAQSSVLQSGQKTPTWPQLTIEFLRELPDQPARLRLILDSPVFSLIQGAELRLRADRIGAILVWPDQRSYRPLAPGTTSALFSDKRADRLPFVEPTFKQLEEQAKGGRVVSRHQIESALGTFEMELAQIGDLPYAAPLLCQILLDMVRIRATEQMCPEGGLPIRLQANWKAGGGFLFEVLGYKQESKLPLDGFRMPPSLPIFKQGELPPSEPYVLPEKLRAEIFPIKKMDFAPRPVPPPVPPPGPVTSPPLESPVEQLLAADEIDLENATMFPLLVQLDRFPYLWLAPGETRNLRVRGAPVFYAARDFWGHVQLEPGLVSAPSRIVFAIEGTP